MFLASNQNYSDVFIVKTLKFKHVILSVQKHLILEMLFFKKSMIKPFYHDLKRKMKITCNPKHIGIAFKNVSDTRANIVTNARTLKTMVNG